LSLVTRLLGEGAKTDQAGNDERQSHWRGYKAGGAFWERRSVGCGLRFGRAELASERGRQAAAPSAGWVAPGLPLRLPA